MVLDPAENKRWSYQSILNLFEKLYEFGWEPVKEGLNIIALKKGNKNIQINDIELRDNLKKALTKLEGKEAIIIQLYFVEELNIYEIAEILDVSTGRISQIKSNAIKKVRDFIDKKLQN